MNIYIIGSLTCCDKIYEMYNVYSKRYNTRYVYELNNKMLENAIKKCYDNIEWCDIVIAVSKDNKLYGDGVKYELEYARRLNKNIIYK